MAVLRGRLCGPCQKLVVPPRNPLKIVLCHFRFLQRRDTKYMGDYIEGPQRNDRRQFDDSKPEWQVLNTQHREGCVEELVGSASAMFDAYEVHHKENHTFRDMTIGRSRGMFQGAVTNLSYFSVGEHFLVKTGASIAGICAPSDRTSFSKVAVYLRGAPVALTLEGTPVNVLFLREAEGLITRAYEQRNSLRHTYAVTAVRSSAQHVCSHLRNSWLNCRESRCCR